MSVVDGIGSSYVSFMINCCDNGLIARISLARAHTPRYRHKRMKPSKYDKGGASHLFEGLLIYIFRVV